MALPATDSFTTGSDQLLTVYSANWTINGSGTFTVVAATDDVKVDSTAEYGAHWNADTFGDNQYSQAVLTGTSDGTWLGVAVRCASGSTLTFYEFYGSTTDNTNQLAKENNGTWTQLGSNGTSWVNGQTIRVEANGTTITPLINGSGTGTPGAQTDNSITSGYAGLSAGLAGTNTRMDNWEGGNLGGTTSSETGTGVAIMSGSGASEYVKFPNKDDFTLFPKYTMRKGARQ